MKTHLGRFCFCKSILKKSVTVTEMPSAIFHYTQANLTAQEPNASKQVDTIFEAAKKDLLTLMKLDVSCYREGKVKPGGRGGGVKGKF